MENVNNLNGVPNFGHGEDTPGDVGEVPNAPTPEVPTPEVAPVAEEIATPEVEEEME